MKDGAEEGSEGKDKSLDLINERKNGYLVECARADFFGYSRPPVFKKLKKKLNGSELSVFLDSIESYDFYKQQLKKLQSFHLHTEEGFKHNSRLPVFDHIPQMHIQETVRLWENCLRILNSPKKRKSHFQARTIIKALNEEWERRSQAEYKLDEYFSWPTIEAEIGDGSISAGKWPEEGMLSYMGYKVGRTEGKSDSIRLIILREIFEGILPPVFPKEYMNEWHHPGTAYRLKKMAETIAALIRNAKRRQDDRMAFAIDQWEIDLKHLYDRYYVGKFHFAWPICTEMVIA